MSAPSKALQIRAIASTGGLEACLRTFDRYKSRFGDKSGGRKVTLLTHSMGNISLATFLQYRYQRGNLQPGLFDSVILTSA